jgi:hypothetical protein
VQVQLETVRKRLEILAAEQDDLSMAIHEAGQERAEASAVLDEARARICEHGWSSHATSLQPMT